MSLIENLLTLFNVDKQVRGLRTRLETAQRYLAAQTKQVEVLHQQQAELQTRRKHLQATIANSETEIKGIDQRLEKYRGDLNSASTNKQYTAVLTELNTVKASRGAVEDKMLADMEQIEKIDAEIKALDAQLIERNKVREVAKHQLEERKADVGQRLSELEVERQKAAAVIPAHALAVFDEMANAHDGEAMAQVEVIDRRNRDYACGACNLHVPFDQVSLLASRSESLTRCPACSRILYMQEEVRGALVKK